MKPKCKLTGRDGNAFAIIGAAKKALKKSGADQTTINQYIEEAMAADYNHLLRVTMKYVDVE